MPGELANNLSGLLNSTEIDGIFGSITTAATYPRTYHLVGWWDDADVEWRAEGGPVYLGVVAACMSPSLHSHS